MGRSVPHNLKSTHQTEFVKIFNSLCGRYGRWEIWQDFVTLAAIAISNTVDRSQAAEREKTYMTIAGKYKPDEMLKFSQMLQEVVVGMDFNPDQAFSVNFTWRLIWAMTTLDSFSRPMMSAV